MRLGSIYSAIVRTPKNPKKAGMEKLLKGRGDPKEAGILEERGDAFSLGIFVAGVWQM